MIPSINPADVLRLDAELYVAYLHSMIRSYDPMGSVKYQEIVHGG